MNINNWCEVDEAISVAISDETFRQYAGLSHSEKVLKRLSSMAMQNAVCRDLPWPAEHGYARRAEAG